MKIDPIEADKVLAFLINISSNEWDLRQYLGYDKQTYVDAIYDFLGREKPLWIDIDRRFKNNPIARINRGRESEIRSFLAAGGFDAIDHKEKEAEARKARIVA